MSRPHAHRPRFARRVIMNPIAVAIESAQKLSERDRLALQGIVRQAFDEFTRGREPARQWVVLADALNVAESLAAPPLRICADNASRQRIADGQRVLAHAHQRHTQRGTWALRGPELGALGDAVWLHGVQLDHCSLGEYERAIEFTRRRVQQARAGNAPAGAIVIEGALA